MCKCIKMALVNAVLKQHMDWKCKSLTWKVCVIWLKFKGRHLLLTQKHAKILFFFRPFTEQLENQWKMRIWQKMSAEHLLSTWIFMCQKWRLMVHPFVPSASHSIRHYIHASDYTALWHNCIQTMLKCCQNCKIWFFFLENNDARLLLMTKKRQF